MADWPADPGEVRQWTFIVSRGLVHENVNCDDVWNDGDGPEVTVLVEVVGRRGHDLVLAEVLREYGAGLCGCATSGGDIAKPSLPRSQRDRGADAVRAEGL